MRLISCGRSKRDRRTTAENMYIGTLFCLGVTWAKQSPDGLWGILSAKHGLLLPHKVIYPYDETFARNTYASETWVKKVYTKLPVADIFEIAAPQRYAVPLKNWVGNRALWVYEELPDKRIGYQQGWLKRNIK